MHRERHPGTKSPHLARNKGVARFVRHELGQVEQDVEEGAGQLAGALEVVQREEARVLLGWRGERGGFGILFKREGRKESREREREEARVLQGWGGHRVRQYVCTGVETRGPGERVQAELTAALGLKTVVVGRERRSLQPALPLPADSPPSALAQYGSTPPAARPMLHTHSRRLSTQREQVRSRG